LVSINVLTPSQVGLVYTGMSDVFHELRSRHGLHHLVI